MLLTSDSRQIKIPKTLKHFDERCWTSAELGLALPLFFCTLKVKTDIGWQQRAVITALIGQLKPVTLIGGADATLLSIQLISPGWLNKSGFWKMDALHSMQEISSLDEEHCSFVYVLQSGDRYTEIINGDHLAGPTKVRTILKCPCESFDEES
jgi:hypothetical protein